MFQLLYLVEASGLICLGNTEPGIRRAAESVLGGWLRTASADSSPAFHFGDIVRLCSWEVVAHDFGLPTFLRFAQFRVIGISLALMDFKFNAKRRKSQKVSHLFAPASRGRGPVDICNNQPDTHVPLASRHNQ